MTRIPRLPAVTPRRVSPVAAIAALLFVAGPAARAAEPPAFDRSRIDWHHAELEAHKLFRSMRVEIAVRRPDPGDVAASLVADDGHALLAPGEHVAALSYLTDGLGRRNAIDMLIEPGSGQVLQRISSESGKRLKYRVYRFGREGALRRTARPAQGEEDTAPEAWSDRTQQWFPFPADRDGAPVTESSALVYLVAISKLERPGDRFEVDVFSSSNETITRIVAEALAPDRVNFDYRLEQPGAGSSERRGRAEAIRVSIRDAGSGGDDVLELFGMQNVELLLDPVTRAPLTLQGRVGIFGGVTFELKRLELRP